MEKIEDLTSPSMLRAALYFGFAMVILWSMIPPETRLAIASRIVGGTHKPCADCDDEALGLVITDDATED